MKFLLCLFRHDWSHWRLTGRLQYYKRWCWRCWAEDRHSVWECAEDGHVHP